MKILVVCQYYYPEPFRITDICEEMVRRGHEVQVVTGYPNYPEGVLYDGYGKGKKIDEIINGVKVHRCYTIPRKTGALYRFLNYYSYCFSSSRYIKNCMSSNGMPFDIVFVNQLSPVMMGKAAVKYKKKFRVPTIMYCLDIWPESLIAGGIKRTSLLYKFFHRVSRKIYRQMDKILITSQLFSEYLEQEFEIESQTIEYLPQYAEGIFDILPEKKKSDRFNFMFAGNIGAVQSVDTIINAADILRGEKVTFHIVGGGIELDKLQEAVYRKNLKNVVFYGRRPLEEMPGLYQTADAMLVTMKADPVLSLTLPGKVQSYMAAGKPIIGAIGGETKKIIELANCGYCGEAENEQELVRNIKKFMSDLGREKMGENARHYYEDHFEQNKFMNHLEKEFANWLQRGKSNESSCI